MKLAYRILTPVLSLGAVVMGFLLKLFYFRIGGASDELQSIVQLAQLFNVKDVFEFSAVDIISLLTQSDLSAAAEGEANLLTVAEPIIPHIIAFLVFWVAALLLFLATGIVAAATNKRKAVIGMSVGGLVILFVCIIISNLAFGKVLGGEIALSDLMSLFSDNVGMQLLAIVVTIKEATLSAGFYAVFGMYLLVIFWTVLTNMLVNTPIQKKKTHRRKKPLKKLSAIFGR